MEPPAEETDKPTDRPTNPPFTKSPVTPAPSTPAEEATEPEGCAGTPCPLASECRSQYGFCGVSFIYCNAASSWTLETCGLSGSDASGVQLLCDADVRKCPGGEFVYRDPSNECEHFPCPEEKEEERFVTPSAFNIPAPGPRFSELPKPTLPKIDMQNPTTTKPTGIIDLGKQPSGLNTLVVIGKSEDVEDDKDESSSATKNEEEESEPSNYDMGFGGFSAGDWSSSGAHDRRQKPLVLLAFSILAFSTVW